jgi:hypothetical protein
MTKSLKPGDQVSFLNEAGSGVVKSLSGNDKCIIEDEFGFEYEYPINELVINRNIDYKISDATIEKKLRDKLTHREPNTQEAEFERKFRHLNKISSFNSSEEIDLHIEQLVDFNPKHMSNAEILSIQITHFERMMQHAILNHQRKIIFIHGVGEGVLKTEIRRLLREVYPETRYHDASYRKYGYGATEVIISY